MTILSTTNRPEQFHVMEFEKAHAYEAGMHAREMSLRPEFQSVSMILTNPDRDFDFEAGYKLLGSKGQWGLRCPNNALDTSFQEMNRHFGSAFSVFSTIVGCYNINAEVMASGQSIDTNSRTHIDGPAMVDQDANKKGVVMTLCVNEAGTDLIEAPVHAFKRNTFGWDNYLCVSKDETQTWKTSSYTLNIMRMSNWPEAFYPCPHNIPDGIAYSSPRQRTIFVARPNLIHC